MFEYELCCDLLLLLNVADTGYYVEGCDHFWWTKFQNLFAWWPSSCGESILVLFLSLLAQDHSGTLSEHTDL